MDLVSIVGSEIAGQDRDHPQLCDAKQFLQEIDYLLDDVIQPDHHHGQPPDHEILQHIGLCTV